HRRERGDRSPAPPQSAPGRAARSRAGRGRRTPRCDHGAARPVGATAGGARRAAAPASHGGRAVRRGRLLARRDRGHPRHPRGHRALGGVPRASPAARTAGRLEGAGMTREPLPFDHRPDPALGAALRQALEPPAGGRGGPGLSAGELERKWRDAEPSDRVGHAAARHDLRRGDRSRRGRPGPLGPRRLRRRARARPGSRAARGRIDRRAGADAGAARLRPRHPAAALYPHGRGVGHGPTALRRAAGGDGLGSDGAPHAGPAGEVSRPYGPASASQGEDRLERKEAMTSVRHHPTAALAAIICLGMPGAVAAQGQAPLEVTLAEAIRRSLDVQPAMVQARGAARNAGAGERSAWGAFLPTVSTSASASRSNTSSFRTGTTDTLPPLYSYSGGLSASLVLFDGFSRFANLRSSAATQDAA